MDRTAGGDGDPTGAESHCLIGVGDRERRSGVVGVHRGGDGVLCWPIRSHAAASASSCAPGRGEWRRRGLAAALSVALLLPLLLLFALHLGVADQSTPVRSSPGAFAYARRHQPKGSDGVHQWHLCQPSDSSLRAAERADAAAALRAGRPSTLSQLRAWPRPRDAPLATGDERVTDGSNAGCMAFVPTAHSVGLSGHPRLPLTLRAEHLAEQGHTDATRQRFPAPWHMQLLVHELRYSADRGGFLLLVLLDDIDMRMISKEGAAQQSTRNNYDSRQDKIMDKIFPHNTYGPGAAPLLCAFQHAAAEDGGGGGGDGPSGGGGSEFRGNGEGVWLPSTLAERVPSVASPMSHYEIFCPYPGAPRAPPPLLHLRLSWSASFLKHYAYAPKAPERVLQLPPLTVVPICRQWSPLRSLVYCGRLSNPVYYSSLLDFIGHHAHLGVELFDLEDAYGLHRELLAPWLRAGSVAYTRRSEHAFFWMDGQPAPAPLWYNQRPHQDVCRYRHYDSARWVAFFDLDEYLFFENGDMHKNRTATAATAAASSPSSSPSSPPSLDPSTAALTPIFAATCLRRTADGGAVAMDYDAPDESPLRSAHSCSDERIAAHAHTFTSAPMPHWLAGANPMTPHEYSLATGLRCGCRSVIGDYLSRVWLSRRSDHSLDVHAAGDSLMDQQHLRFATWNHNFMEPDVAAARVDFLTRHSPYTTADPPAVCFLDYFASDPPLLLQFPYPDQGEPAVVNSKYFVHPQSSCSLFIHNAWQCAHGAAQSSLTAHRPPQPRDQVYFIHMQNAAHMRRPSAPIISEQRKDDKIAFVRTRQRQMSEVPLRQNERH
jgi:hypothetical protein